MGLLLLKGILLMISDAGLCRSLLKFIFECLKVFQIFLCFIRVASSQMILQFRWFHSVIAQNFVA
ncbi:unnamed protein product [Acanthoscelides obtectus]|uniref:Uncharacterized protein n=1 Tax=Acanthoscelides obtectus TaxID=200917 RepID=A0A9P0JYJ3_ACAOB|nr:unnamed protein product [Acanthoscelides obtectus]CAK1648640.1 hypothetical protein AOBTE_LOCUS15797 [Acanthoscelides obtectus]